MTHSNSGNIMPLVARWLTPASIVVAAFCGANAHAASMNDDLKHRNSIIHWPEHFQPESAALFSHNQLLPRRCAPRIRYLLQLSPEGNDNLNGQFICDGLFSTYANGL